MIYYTQLIFLHEGKEDVFLEFEDHILPILATYNGTLMYRVRPSSDSVVATTAGYPYEVHLVSFPSREDFLAYAADKERQLYMNLKNESVAKVLLVEGHSI
jgi:hypothetical protein